MTFYSLPNVTTALIRLKNNLDIPDPNIIMDTETIRLVLKSYHKEELKIFFNKIILHTTIDAFLLIKKEFNLK